MHYFTHYSRRIAKPRRLFSALLLILCFTLLNYLDVLDWFGEDYDLTRNIDHWISETIPNCSRLIEQSSMSEEADLVWQARKWHFSESKFKRALFDPETMDKCQAIREKLEFHSAPLSDEEAEYPLAYGLLVYKSSIQVYLLLSAIYQPQNAYCIAIDSKASSQFKQDMEMLSDCFRNIFVMATTSDVEWCGFSVARSVFNCLRYLSEIRHDWKYFQYLAGVSLPLKTNLEMVRIFNRLNATVNADIAPFPNYRFLKANKNKQPLPLWKASLSILLPRETANTIIRSDKVQELLSYLKDTWCADESMWTTILGNKQVFRIPGSFDASSILAKTRQEQAQIGKLINSTKSLLQTPEEPFPLRDYYIARYQVWQSHVHTPCAGKYVKYSCVFGIGDLSNLLIRPEMVAHKLYLDFEPAAYFCLYQAVRRRALDKQNQERFRGEVYSKLPQVRMARGEFLEDVQFYFTDW